MTCAVFHNIACTVDRHQAEFENVEEFEEVIDNILDLENVPNNAATNRVNYLLNYFRQRNEN